MMTPTTRMMISMSGSASLLEAIDRLSAEFGARSLEHDLILAQDFRCGCELQANRKGRGRLRLQRMAGSSGGIGRSEVGGGGFRQLGNGLADEAPEGLLRSYQLVHRSFRRGFSPHVVGVQAAGMALEDSSPLRMPSHAPASGLPSQRAATGWPPTGCSRVFPLYTASRSTADCTRLRRGVQ